MTVKEFMNVLSSVDPDMEILIEGRDSTGEYCDANEMTKKNIYIGDERIVIVSE